MLGKLKKKILDKYFYHIVSLYPPYLGAGISARQIDKLGREVLVKMKLNKFNKNYVGTHFGGSLYSMCDPFYMLILLRQLGGEYIVWDKEAKIKFISPGRGDVSAHFKITEEDLINIKEQLNNSKTYEPTFHVEVKDKSGNLIALVEKKLWIKKKRAR